MYWFDNHRYRASASQSVDLVSIPWWWCCCCSTPSEGWGRGGTPWRPNSRATPQGLGQRSKREEIVPKVARREARMRDSQGGDKSDPSCCLNVVVRSPSLCLRGGSKRRDNYPEGRGHPVAPNRLRFPRWVEPKEWQLPYLTQHESVENNPAQSACCVLGQGS